MRKLFSYTFHSEKRGKGRRNALLIALIHFPMSTNLNCVLNSFVGYATTSRIKRFENFSRSPLFHSSLYLYFLILLISFSSSFTLISRSSSQALLSPLFHHQQNLHQISIHQKDFSIVSYKDNLTITIEGETFGKEFVFNRIFLGR